MAYESENGLTPVLSVATSSRSVSLSRPSRRGFATKIAPSFFYACVRPRRVLTPRPLNARVEEIDTKIARDYAFSQLPRDAS